MAPVPGPDQTQFPFVGREEERARLADILTEVRSGSGRVVLVGGEAGVGKTRLLSEALVGQDLRILSGWCLPESHEPLLPLREALREADLAESIFAETPPRLASLWLMDSSGLLMVKLESAAGDLDGDIFAGMLTAVRDFVAQSLGDFGGDHAGGLEVLGSGDHRIVLEAAGEHLLVAILEGMETERFLTDLNDLAEQIVLVSSRTEWEGDLDELGPFEMPLKEFFSLPRYQGGETLPDDPRLRRERIFESIISGLRRLSLNGPIALVLEDLQWADPGTLEACGRLARGLADAPVLVAGTWRPEEVDSDHPLNDFLTIAGDLGEVIHLEGLDQTTVKNLIEQTLGEVDPTLLQDIMTRSGGNAFFVRELISAGALDIGDLPTAIGQVVERRIQHLPEEDRDLLDLASIFRPGAEVGLLACAAERDPEELRALLDTRSGAGAITWVEGPIFAFDHSTYRDVLRENLPSDLLTEYHRMIAECYLEQVPDAHFELSHHFSAADDPRALAPSLAAADLAFARFDTGEARNQWDIATRSSPGIAERLRIAEGRGDAAELISEFQQALVHYDDALDEAVAGADRARFLRKGADVLERANRYAEARQRLAKVIEITDLPDRERQAIELLDTTVLTSQGEYAEAESRIEAIRQDPDLPEDLLGQALHQLGSIHIYQGNFLEARTVLEEGLALRTRLGDLRGQAATTNNLGTVLQRLADQDASLALFERSIAVQIQIGDRQARAMAEGNIGGIHWEHGDLPEARRWFESAVATHKSIGSLQGANSLGGLGNLLFYQGDLEGARQHFLDALSMQEAAQDLNTQGVPLQNLGELERQAGNLPEARRYIERSLEIRTELGQQRGIALTRGVMADILADEGDVKAALIENQAAMEIVTELGLRQSVAMCFIREARLLHRDGQDGREAARKGLEEIPAGDKDLAEAWMTQGKVEEPYDRRKAKAAYEKAKEIYAGWGNRNKVEKIEAELAGLG